MTLHFILKVSCAYLFLHNLAAGELLMTNPAVLPFTPKQGHNYTGKGKSEPLVRSLVPNI